MERRLAVLARATQRQVALLAIVLVSATVDAAPKKADANAEFRRGVAAYSKKDYAAAAEALAKSYALEPDIETLFAWAQAERQRENCEKAIELYDRLLGEKLPDENKQVVREKRDECKAIIEAKKPPPVVEPKPEPKPAPAPAPEPPLPEKPRADRPSRFGPVGLGLVGIGAIGLGVGGYFLNSGNKASKDAATATNYFETERLNAKADSHGRNGVIGAVGGGVLLVAGVVWIVTRSTEERPVVTGWIAPSGGGLAASGRF